MATPYADHVPSTDEIEARAFKCEKCQEAIYPYFTKWMGPQEMLGGDSGCDHTPDRYLLDLAPYIKDCDLVHRCLLGGRILGRATGECPKCEGRADPKCEGCDGWGEVYTSLHIHLHSYCEPEPVPEEANTTMTDLPF